MRAIRALAFSKSSSSASVGALGGGALAPLCRCASSNRCRSVIARVIRASTRFASATRCRCCRERSVLESAVGGGATARLASAARCRCCRLRSVLESAVGVPPGTHLRPILDSGEGGAKVKKFTSPPASNPLTRADSRSRIRCEWRVDGGEGGARQKVLRGKLWRYAAMARGAFLSLRVLVEDFRRTPGLMYNSLITACSKQPVRF